MAETVCILTAGRGTRMGAYATYLNKAVLPVGRKAVISRIIEKFPPDTRFVVGLGFLSDQVRNYLEIAHPDRRFQFVPISHFEGPGSGPGLSLLTCREYLQRPFFFVSCDTLWENDLEMGSLNNWMGVARVDPASANFYCNMRVRDGRIVEIRDKVHVQGKDFLAFVGLCYIRDYGVFFDALESKERIAGEHQVSNGLRALVDERTVLAKEIDWTDVGDLEKYRTVVRRYENFDFSKPNEALFIVGDRVIKLFADVGTANRRVARARLAPKVFPEITDHRGQLYAYQYWNGRTLYECNSPEIFKRLLSWLSDNLWREVTVGDAEVAEACRRFYRDKTVERVAQYHGKYRLEDSGSVVNGSVIPATEELLARVPWERLYAGIPRLIHGDLQFDNILCQAEGESFLLLDWRQDFGGHLEWGDLYYDLAKLYGGIVLNYDYIKQNMLTYREVRAGIVFDFAQRFQTPVYLAILNEFIVRSGWDLGKTRLLVSLIYLNMAPLHMPPFDKMLYSLGRQMLYRELAGVRDTEAG